MRCGAWCHVLDEAVPGTAALPAGLLPGNAYRELAVGTATGGRVGLRHLLSTAPFDKETGWHRHGWHYVVVPVTDGTLLLELPGGQTCDQQQER